MIERALLGGVLLGALLLTAGVAGAGPPLEQVLVVEATDSGERLLAAPVADGTVVALHYTHSVEKTPVSDVYEVDAERLAAVRMEFESYGAGLPARAAVNRTDDGAFVYEPDGAFERLHVAPGGIAGHELQVGERTYDLVALSDGRPVTIYVAWRAAGEAAWAVRA